MKIALRINFEKNKMTLYYHFVISVSKAMAIIITISVFPERIKNHFFGSFRFAKFSFSLTEKSFYHLKGFLNFGKTGKMLA